MRIDLLPTILAAAPPAALFLLARFPELALAGGLPRDAAIGVEPRDADLVIVGPVSAELREFLSAPKSWLRRLREAARAIVWPGVTEVAGDNAAAGPVVPGALVDAHVVETPRAVTLVPTRDAGAGAMPVQVIRAEHLDVAAALASFDFGACQVAVRVLRAGADLSGFAEIAATALAQRGEPEAFAVLEALPAFACDLPGRWLRYASPRDNDAAGSIRRALDLVGRGCGWKLEPDELQRMVAAQLDRHGAADADAVADMVVASSALTASSRAALRAAMSGLPGRHAFEPDRSAMPIPASEALAFAAASGLPTEYYDVPAELFAPEALADHGGDDLFADARPTIDTRNSPYAGCGCPEHDMGCARLPPTGVVAGST